MYQSGETRWFFRGEIPDGVRSWFDSGQLGRCEPERTDLYLGIPSCRTAGLKLREGRLELKALVCRAGLREYADGVTAVREAWVKWSCDTAGEAVRRELMADTDDLWIAVRKNRSLRRFSIRNGIVEEMDADAAQAVPGCHVELTAISVLPGRKGLGPVEPRDWGPAQPWWSLSLESFGDPHSTLLNLDRAAQFFFDDPPPVVLPESGSYSYPAWLAGLQSET